MHIVLGSSWERLGRPGNYIAHLPTKVMGAWQAVRPALREQAAAPGCEHYRRWQGGASDMHDRLGRLSVGESADRQVVLPDQEGAKTTLGLLCATMIEPRESSADAVEVMRDILCCSCGDMCKQAGRDTILLHVENCRCCRLRPGVEGWPASVATLHMPMPGSVDHQHRVCQHVLPVASMVPGEPSRCLEYPSGSNTVLISERQLGSDGKAGDRHKQDLARRC
jgi:hypothetical protein